MYDWWEREIKNKYSVFFVRWREVLGEIGSWYGIEVLGVCILGSGWNFMEEG